MDNRNLRGIIPNPNWYILDDVSREIRGEVYITRIEIPVKESPPSTISRLPKKKDGTGHGVEHPSDFRKRGGRDGVKFKII